ncbi:alpha/beta hydrolase [Nocardia jiangxiensis]|uniref:alpha/beta hydrolase n=1 Tax=Nocardia jiangxiensis TaxID=282685 RepID=UPI0002D88215|nr:alpha/beta hydrolase [Nocardia jiangxiensis]
MTDSDVATPSPIGPPVPFDPELAAALEVILPHMPTFTSVESIPQIRARAGDLLVDRSNEDLSREGALHVEEVFIPGAPGAQISLIICRPVRAQAPTAAFYHTHGGGMILGSNRMISDEMLDWMVEFDATLISVDYRLAPDTPHPGPVEDCYTGLTWVADHAAELGIDPARIVIAGESAGGGLAAATALLARDRQGPAIAAQVLMCPMLDDRNDTPSAIQGEGRGVWHRHTNEIGWSALLGESRGGPDVSPYAAPARATDLSGLPPTLIDVGSAETFRDEAVAYAGNIWRAGGQAELHVFAGGFHGYDGLAPQATVSQDTKDARIRWLRRIMNS